MGFRNPITTAEAVDTGQPAGAGVRVYNQATATGVRGVVEIRDGIAGDDPSLLTGVAYLIPQGDGYTAQGGETALRSGSWNGKKGPDLVLKVRSAPAGGYESVAQLTGADVLDLGPKAKLRQTTVSPSMPAGYGTLTWQTAGVDLDTYGGWDPAKPTRWTCPAGQGGLYAVEGRVAINSITAGNSATCRLLRDGLAVQGTVGDILRPQATDSQIPGTGRQFITLTPGQYLELQGFALGQAWVTRVTADGVSSTLTIERVG